MCALLQLLTSKPALYVCNVDEASAATGNAHAPRPRPAPRRAACRRWSSPPRSRARSPACRAEDQGEFLETLGLTEPGLNRLIREAYQLLGLQTYFTVGPKEARAWTIHGRATAPQAAGVIHTDFEKGFIRAETIAYDDYVR